MFQPVTKQQINELYEVYLDERSIYVAKILRLIYKSNLDLSNFRKLEYINELYLYPTCPLIYDARCLDYKPINPNFKLKSCGSCIHYTNNCRCIQNHELKLYRKYSKRIFWLSQSIREIEFFK